MASRLESLPLEVLFQILSFLVPPNANMPMRHQPLLLLGQTCRALRQTTSSYAQHLLSVRKQKLPKNKVSSTTRKKNYVRAYLSHMNSHCRFCDRPTTRTACIFNDIRCCKDCDKEKWPRKITFSNAKKLFDLTEDELMRQCRWGTYMVWTVYTRMFLLDEVEELAKRKHGDLEKWQKGREEKRKQKRNRRQPLPLPPSPSVDNGGSSSNLGGQSAPIVIDD